MRLPLAITCGDPAGVGPEIIRRWLDENPERRKDVCLIGPRTWLEECGEVRGCAVGEASYRAVAGKPEVEGSSIAIYALEEAAYGCRQGRYRAVVTGPVSKSWMDKAGWGYPGHTEYFADRWHGRALMAFAGGKMRVVLATWHIPLCEVPNHMTEETLRHAVDGAAYLARKLGAGKEARIGVCGLNPHAGENGLLGFEEQGIIDPLLDAMRDRYPGLSRTLPGDTLFWRHLQGEFDVVIALYHDQGLAPLKTVDFEQSANLTLGLPFVRTSPDHGTAYDLAGKGVASILSFSSAVKMADCLSIAL